MKYGIEYYLSTLTNKSREEIHTLKNKTSLKLREVNALLAEAKQEHIRGYSNQIEYVDLCKLKASLEAELEAIKQALSKSMSDNTQVLTIDAYIEKYRNISIDELTSNVMDFQLENTNLNLKIKQAQLVGDQMSVALLENERIDATNRIIATQKILRARKTSNKLSSKDPGKKVHTAEVYDLERARSQILINTIKSLAKLLPEKSMQDSIAFGFQDFLSHRRIGLGTESLEILNKWAEDLPKMVRPKD